MAPDTIVADVATVTVLIITWIRYKKPDVSMSLNGSLAGLVAITAGCDTVSPTSAAIIGIISGFVVVFGIEFIDKVLKVDDPVGAVGVHGLNGAFGTLAVGLFSVYVRLLLEGQEWCQQLQQVQHLRKYLKKQIFWQHPKVPELSLYHVQKIHHKRL